MGAAAGLLNIDWRTFKKLATEYNLYTPTVSTKWPERFELLDILNGLHPQYPTSKLSKRLVKEGYKNIFVNHVVSLIIMVMLFH